MTSKRRRALVELTSFLVIAGLTTWAVLADGAQSFWAQHQFVAGMATGFASLGLTIFTVDRLLAWRESRRWERVAIVAYRGIGRSAPDISFELAALYCDLTHHDQEPPPPGNAMSPLDGVGPASPAKLSLAIFRSPLPAQDIPEEDVIPEDRLRVLIGDDAWCHLASETAKDLVDQNRRTVAEWAVLMMSAEQPRDLVDAFASLNDELFTLSIALQVVQRDRRDETVNNVLMMWRIVDAKARLLTNRLWQHANRGRYAFRLPRQLQRVHLDEALEHLRRLPGWEKVRGFRFVGDPYLP